MIYGYARCSTSEQYQDINRQVRELKQQGATDDTIYLEYESGMKENRVELNKLLKVVGPGDSIISTEVSRITRSTKQLCEIIEFAKGKNIKLVMGTFEVDCTKKLDPMTEGMLLLSMTYPVFFSGIIRNTRTAILTKKSSLGCAIFPTQQFLNISVWLKVTTTDYCLL